ncbi:MAG: acylphosphatase [Candidatus Kapabacteria bacterium]|nr:acylphosphatase [Candidatus Kapabacteria bacterium]
METVRYTIEGQVQGVGYRRYALHHAHRLYLHGFVTNLEDGAVECLAQGTVEALTEFEMILRQGPQHATVTSVNCEELPNHRLYHTFRIL